MKNYSIRSSGNNPKQALANVKRAAINEENIFTELMAAVRYCYLGQIADALYQVGGQYRRNM